jgi:hypothetical protein
MGVGDTVAISWQPGSGKDRTPVLMELPPPSFPHISPMPQACMMVLSTSMVEHLPLVNPLWKDLTDIPRVCFTNLWGSFQSNQVDNQSWPPQLAWLFVSSSGIYNLYVRVKRGKAESQFSIFNELRISQTFGNSNRNFNNWNEGNAAECSAPIIHYVVSLLTRSLLHLLILHCVTCVLFSLVAVKVFFLVFIAWWWYVTVRLWVL